MSVLPMTATGLTVRRSTRSSRFSLGGLGVVIAVLAVLPYIEARGTQTQLVELFVLIVLATMWNLLAGYGGMVSIGQQAFIGAGGYAVVYLGNTVGLNPLLAIPLAGVFCALLALPVSLLTFRLVGGYFAIGTWVVAEVLKLFTTQIHVLGAGSGISLHGLSDYDPGVRIAYVYWASLVVTVVVVGGTYLLMRSHLGLGLMTVRDDAVAASSLGVRVRRSKRIVYAVAAGGCGLAGGLVACNTLRVQPDSIYSVQYTAFMVFMVIIGGIGTMEGPVVGAIVFYTLQNQLDSLGSWYLVILGLVAIVITLLAPRGIWGWISRDGRFEIFPIGHTVVEGRSST